MEWSALFQQSQGFVSTSRFNAWLGVVMFCGFGLTGMSIAFYQMFKQSRADRLAGTRLEGKQRLLRTMQWIGMGTGTIFAVFFFGGMGLNLYKVYRPLQLVQARITGTHTRQYRGTQYFIDAKVTTAQPFDASGKIKGQAKKSGEPVSLRVLKHLYDKAKRGESITAVMLGSSTVGIKRGNRLVISPNN